MTASFVDATVRFVLVGERRRRFIQWNNQDPPYPNSYVVWRRRLIASTGEADASFREGEHRLCAGRVPELDQVAPRGRTLVPGGWPPDSLPSCATGDPDGTPWLFW